ncbi:hypothetical protein BDZ45DRAFT_732657 [Acephala macrosclerotiorum]|nr:hypothetical protein BDZ45DRAFT_732657 [Acephala macrosclerotiorum]
MKSYLKYQASIGIEKSCPTTPDRDPGDAQIELCQHSFSKRLDLSPLWTPTTMHRPKAFDPPWIDFYKTPCPYFITQHTTFPKFSLLPKELQLLIWRYAEEDPRTILISADFSRTNGLGFHINLVQKKPGTLETSYDARVAAQKIYRPILNSIFPMRPPLVYFNLASDRMEIDLKLLNLFKSNATKRPFVENELPLVKRLTVEMQNVLLTEAHLVKICRFFSGLTHLQIIQKIPYYTDNDDVPHTYKPSENSAVHNWPRIEPLIKAPIDFVRSKLKEWKPPILIIGSWLQWQGLEDKLRERQRREQELEKEIRGEMEWEPTIAITIPSLEYVPMYQGEYPKGSYTIAV